MKKSILLPLAAILGLSLFSLTGCQSNGGDVLNAQNTQNQTETPDEPSEAADETETPAPQEDADGPSVIKVAGSTSVAPLMKELADAYETKAPGITIEIQETGSSAGINATIEGAAHLGMSSRDLSGDEIAQGLEYTEIALDGIAVVVNAENPVTGLSMEEIAGIFSGEIDNWNQVGGTDAAINVISREEGSGTRGAFEELLKLEDISGDAMFENSTGAVKLSVSVDANAIGYISLGSMDDSVQSLEVDGVVCSTGNVKNKSYAIARPFLVCSMGEFEKSVSDFMDFILSDEGQDIVLDNNYIDVR